MGEDKKSNRWVSAWSTSPIDASLSETGVLDRLGVAVTDVSARTAVQLTAVGRAEVDVLAAPGTHACVIFGDSTVANELPRLLAARLRADGIDSVSVTQAAIKGDRLVADGVGRAAKLLGGAGVKRFERDVLAQAGADMVLVKLGANDLIHPHCRSKQGLLTPVTFAQMTAGYRALADMAHAQGVRIWFCELTPWKGYTRNLFGRGDDIQWSPELDTLRPELNAWFQSADCPADGYIPLGALANPDDPDALIPAYTTDGVHHTPAGQRALAALIPEDIFRAPQKEVSPRSTSDPQPQTICRASSRSTTRSTPQRRPAPPASAGCAASIRRARPHRPRSTTGHCLCSPTAVRSSPPDALTGRRCRSTRRCRGNTQRRRSRCSCCTRSSWTRQSPGTATARSSCAFMPGAPARSAARCCASTRMQKTPLPAGSTPISASARPPSCRAPSTASQA